MLMIELSENGENKENINFSFSFKMMFAELLVLYLPFLHRPADFLLLLFLFCTAQNQNHSTFFHKTVLFPHLSPQFLPQFPPQFLPPPF
nr:unnamed protein product [Meloidogyne enterolobii]